MLSLEINSTLTIHPLVNASNLELMDGLRVDDMYNGYCWYSFITSTSDHKEVSISICLHNDQFDSAHVALSNSDLYGSDWSDWTEEKQQKCAADTREWLSKKGFKPGDYDWGSLWCGYDAKSGSGHAVFRCNS